MSQQGEWVREVQKSVKHYLNGPKRHSLKYRRPSLFADFLSAILSICDSNYGISEDSILQFTNTIGLVICKFVIFEFCICQSTF
jgi:hypothetical protein